jgi:hypothetical protein
VVEGGTQLPMSGGGGEGAAGAADNAENDACVLSEVKSDEENMMLLFSSWRMVAVELSKLPQE